MSLLRFFLIITSTLIVACAHIKGPKTSPSPQISEEEEAQPPKQVIATHFELSEAMSKLCLKLQSKFTEYQWGAVDCNQYHWNHVRNSNQGTPLVWTVFGDDTSEKARANTTLILCGVHGDEITPVKFCWDLLSELKNNHSYEDKLIVVAPIVSPDSFLIEKPTRTNGRGVDVNRNFPTTDWKSDAHKRWKQHLKSDKRKFPGFAPASEQETIFQMNLILRYKPNKVISVHAPLTLLDYDGPSLTNDDGKKAKILLDEMSSKASGYKVSNYPIFPGSLGNWAGKEKHIPTYTLELPNSNPAETNQFWLLFKDSVNYAIHHVMKPTVD
jgi:protein MpaA